MPKTTDRQIVVSRLMSNHGVRTADELMNILQGSGQVSDNCVTIDDVDAGDLMRAYTRTITGEGK